MTGGGNNGHFPRCGPFEEQKVVQNGWIIGCAEGYRGRNLKGVKYIFLILKERLSTHKEPNYFSNEFF